MQIYKLFLDIISTFVYPFNYTRAQLVGKLDQHDAKMLALARMLSDGEHGMSFDTHPHSWYMHLLAFHAKDLQLEFLRKYNRPLACFSLQQCEFSNKVKKNAMVSLYSFTNRPVGNSKCAAPAWKNKNGFLIFKTRICQLYYAFLIGRQRNPYRCGNCGEYDGHNAGSKLCPVNIMLRSLDEFL